MLEQLFELVLAVIVTVVLPVLVNEAAGIVNVPLPGVPDVNDNEAVNPVAVLAPFKS